jgi:hypothetical protein
MSEPLPDLGPRPPEVLLAQMNRRMARQWPDDVERAAVIVDILERELRLAEAQLTAALERKLAGPPA